MRDPDSDPKVFREILNFYVFKQNFEIVFQFIRSALILDNSSEEKQVGTMRFPYRYKQLSQNGLQTKI